MTPDLCTPPAGQRPLRAYLPLVVVVPMAIAVLMGHRSMLLPSVLTTGCVLTTLHTIYGVVERRWDRRGPAWVVLALHGAIVIGGTAVGSFAASAVLGVYYGHPVLQVFVSVFRIAIVVSLVVVTGLVLFERALLAPSDPPEPPASADPPDRLVARQGSALHLFDPGEVTRLYATDKYTALTYDGREYLLDESLSTLSERLQARGFLRTHRGELVNLRHVREFDGSSVLLSDGQRARVSRRAAATVRRALSA